MTYLLALDQGTSSSRSLVFDAQGRVCALAQRELAQIYPRPGWVEHDPREIWATQLATAREALAQAGISAHEVAAIGITNQRETTLVWDRATGAPLCHAIVWQDRRAEPTCVDLRERGLEPTFRAKTGLRLDGYFSGTKLKWILDHVGGARAAAQRGALAFGTVDSWLLWQLTGGAVHRTDVSNASRTLLWNVHTSDWDDELLGLLDIPREILPSVHASSFAFGSSRADLFGASIPICGVAGDQQSALFGQACFTPGMVKNTYGTGCFMLMHTGSAFQPSRHGLLTTRAAQVDTAPTPLSAPLSVPQYALEGSVFIGGAVVQWLRDGLGAIPTSADVTALAASVPDSAGVIVVPAFTGLGAPYWDAQARGAIVGLTRGSTVAHIARAALESIAFQSAALFDAMRRDGAAAAGPAADSAADSAAVRELRVDGGACGNDLLMQFQADLLGIPVLRPQVTETTAQGAAYLAGLGCGVYRDTRALAAQWRVERRFEPQLARADAAQRMHDWERAVRQARAL